MTTQDSIFMAQALRLGRFGLGQTAPNPSVGCVITDAGQKVIGTGWTQKTGRPHAESVALGEAGEAARGGTAYVTLEPCAHTGQTPPCAGLLIEAGLARVVVAIADPDPRVNGGGVAMLKEAGIIVEQGLMAEAAQHDQLGFLLTKTKARPMVTLKLAVSANGFMRTPQGETPWITGALARMRGHMLRAQNDAIITGSGTVLADDPSLDCRLPGLADASPLAAIMSRQTEIPATSKLAIRGTLLYCEGDRDFAGEVIGLDAVTPQAVLADLAQRGVTRVLLESGPQLAEAFVGADLVDRVALFRATHDVAMDGESDIARIGLDMAAFTEGATYALGSDSLTYYDRKGERL